MIGKGKAPATGLTIVIKLGTSSIVSPSYPFLPHLHLLSSIVETVVRLRQLGHRVVLCSSGAIGVGLRRMGLKERGKALSQKQALAAVGQGRLIALWDNLFSQLDQPIAQILLTRNDISDRTRYLNAQNTFSELLQMGVVPIVNENDTVSVSEIKFGDNDTLSAISSAIVHADYLFLLTDVPALYTDNPRRNPGAMPVRVVRDIGAIRAQVSTSTLGTSLGTGGMSTKLIAADLATAAGVTTVVMHSEKVGDIFEIIADGPGPSRENYGSAISGSNGQELEEENNGPLCTRFLRSGDPMRDRKWWIAHGLHAAGTIIIDEGALRAIKRKESGGRLLPAGVVAVQGLFAASQAVRLVVRRRRRREAQVDGNEQEPGGGRGKEPADGTEMRHWSGTIDAGARGGDGNRRGDETPSTSFPSRSESFMTIPSLLPGSGSPTSLNPGVSHTTFPPSQNPAPHSPSIPSVPNVPSAASSVVTANPSPNTPLLQPSMSLSSSIASLDPLSRSTMQSQPQSPRLSGSTSVSGIGVSGLGDRLGRTTLDGGLGGSGLKAEILPPDLGMQTQTNSKHGEEDEWEEIEVAKGLTHYNSVEIDRIKGMKSSHIETILGYCESEHVVDSITFF